MVRFNPQFDSSPSDKDGDHSRRTSVGRALRWNRTSDEIRQPSGQRNNLVIDRMPNASATEQTQDERDSITRVARRDRPRATEGRQEGYARRRLRPHMDEKPKIKYRIGLVMALGLTFLSLFLDILETILFFTTGVGGTVKDIAAVYIFPVAFWVAGAPMWKGKKKVQKILTNVLTLGLGFIPFVSDFMPELTIGTVATILYTRAEDIFESKKATLMKLDSIVRRKRTR